ncbi:ComF family protein [Microbacterium foliorum]|uniref:ComF family protein n=1 Tax=Microbacterium foliorum TaxID=104336 RepID=UPI00373562F8
MPPHPPARAVGLEILALLLAATCAGCDRPETLLCGSCRQSIRPEPLVRRTPAGLEVRAAMPFESVAARCIRRMKDDGETLLARPFGSALGEVVDVLEARADADRPLHLVPIPTSVAAFRRRGYRVPELLIRRAGRLPDRLLVLRGRRTDQRGLDSVSRAENVRGSMRARRVLEGETVVLVDDVVTTGATFDEAARALTDAGAHVLAAVALAATPRHSERNVNASGTRSN